MLLSLQMMLIYVVYFLSFHSNLSIKIEVAVEFLWVGGVGRVGWDVVVSKGT